MEWPPAWVWLQILKWAGVATRMGVAPAFQLLEPYFFPMSYTVSYKAIILFPSFGFIHPKGTRYQICQL